MQKSQSKHPVSLPIWAKGINMEEGINDVEEERNLNSNEILKGLFEIDIANLL